MRIQPPLQWKGGVLCELFKGKGDPSAHGCYRDILLANDGRFVQLDEVGDALGHVLPLADILIQVTLHCDLDRCLFLIAVNIRKLKELICNHSRREVGVELLAVDEDIELVLEEFRNHELTDIEHLPLGLT